MYFSPFCVVHSFCGNCPARGDSTGGITCMWLKGKNEEAEKSTIKALNNDPSLKERYILCAKRNIASPKKETRDLGMAELDILTKIIRIK